jgi:hypothetical protein
MEDEITYPIIRKYSRARVTVMFIFRWLFIVATIACGVVNIVTGGVAWSVVTALTMWWTWTQFINPNTISYNRISQLVKFTEYAVIILIIICLVFHLDWEDWLFLILPAILFPSLGLLVILLVTDFRKQKHNIVPLVIFDFYCLIGSIVLICLQAPWAVIVLTAVSGALLLLSIIILRGSLLKELKKYFSTR